MSIKERIKELVPDSTDDFGLAVVLRAIVGKNVNHLGGIMSGDYEKVSSVCAYWNLAKDSYDDQSEETKRFIGSLFGV